MPVALKWTGPAGHPQIKSDHADRKFSQRDQRVDRWLRRAFQESEGENKRVYFSGREVMQTHSLSLVVSGNRELIKAVIHVASNSHFLRPLRLLQPPNDLRGCL